MPPRAGPTKPRPLALALQASALVRRRNWNAVVTRSKLTAEGYVQPTIWSRTYRVRLSYSLGSQPSVNVISPELQRSSPLSDTHRYRDGSLCLYRPGFRDWRPQDFVGESVVPWVSEWLFFYELWLTTGWWLGGGQHPTVATTRK